MLYFAPLVFNFFLLGVCVAPLPSGEPYLGGPDDKPLVRSKSSRPGLDHEPPLRPTHPLGRSASDALRFDDEKARHTFDRFSAKHSPFRSKRHWPLDARLTWSHLTKTLTKLPPKDRDKLRDGVAARLRASLQRNAQGPEATYQHRREIEEPFLHDLDERPLHTHNFYTRHPEPPYSPAQRRQLELSRSVDHEDLRKTWGDVTRRAQTARDGLAQAPGLKRQVEALHGLGRDMSPSQRKQDEQLEWNTRGQLPDMEEEAHWYNRLARAGEQRHAEPIEANLAEDRARHRAFQGRLHTDRLTPHDELSIMLRGAEQPAHSPLRHLRHEYIGTRAMGAHSRLDSARPYALARGPGSDDEEDDFRIPAHRGP